MFRLMTSALRRLAAISKVVRVRVEFSKKQVEDRLAGEHRKFLVALFHLGHVFGGAVQDLFQHRARQAFGAQQMDKRLVGIQLWIFFIWVSSRVLRIGVGRAAA